MAIMIIISFLIEAINCDLLIHNFCYIGVGLLFYNTLHYLWLWCKTCTKYDIILSLYDLFNVSCKSKIYVNV